MDIEPLCALGGWFLFPECMAATRSSPSSSSLSSIFDQSQPFLLLFLSIIFILLLLSHPSDQVRPLMPISTSTKLILSHSSPSSSSKSSSDTSTNTDLHGKNLHTRVSKRLLPSESSSSSKDLELSSSSSSTMDLHAKERRNLHTRVPARLLRSDSSSKDSGSSSSSSTTKDLHVKERKNLHTRDSTSSCSRSSSCSREFEAGAHEVPSGPNPISNK